jgi:UDPglucose 6-dehydrogenase
VLALKYMAEEKGKHPQLLEAVIEINSFQRQHVIAKLQSLLGEDLRGKVIGLLGLAFKPNTDDMREAPSLTVIGELARRGASIRAYDPVANGEAMRLLAGTPGLSIVDSAAAALAGADALLVVTEWKEFRNPDFEHIKSALAQAVIFDGRNLYEPKLIESFAIEYHAIGRRLRPEA